MDLGHFAVKILELLKLKTSGLVALELCGLLIYTTQRVGLLQLLIKADA